MEVTKRAFRKFIDALSGFYDRRYRKDDGSVKEGFVSRRYLRMIQRLNACYFARYISKQSFSPAARWALHYLALSSGDDVTSVTLAQGENNDSILIYYDENKKEPHRQKCSPGYTDFMMVHDILEFLGSSSAEETEKMISLVDDNQKKGEWRIWFDRTAPELKIQSISFDEGFDFLNSHRSAHPQLDLLASL